MTRIRVTHRPSPSLSRTLVGWCGLASIGLDPAFALHPRSLTAILTVFEFVFVPD